MGLWADLTAEHRIRCELGAVLSSYGEAHPQRAEWRELMTFMDSRMRADLDRYITGDYGERQFNHAEEAVEEAIADDEGNQTLEHAFEYLRREGRMYSADDEDGAQAFDILSDALFAVRSDYECNFCGKPIPKKHSYCSANCAKADAEGL